MADYYKAFEHVCVVTCKNNYEKINILLANSSVGIYILTDKNTLQFKKEPQVNNTSLDYKAIFKVLRKKEFENILVEHFEELPQATPVFYYDECYNWFTKIPLDKVYAMTLKQLKKRNKITKERLSNIPYELKSLMYFYNVSNSNYFRLDKFLQEKYRG